MFKKLKIQLLLSGIAALVRVVQPLNAQYLISVTLAGRASRLVTGWLLM